MVHKQRKSRKRLIINIPDELHSHIKERASHRYMSITGYVLQALVEKILREKQFE